jgi:hypothetical protein
MSSIDRALIKHRLRSRTNPMAMLVAETQFLADALNRARIEAERQTCRADLLLQHIQAANANFAPAEDAKPPSLPLAERAARQQAGMASGHPELLTTDLGDASEHEIAAFDRELSPGIPAEGDA